jgi:hypothetical protein
MGHSYVGANGATDPGSCVQGSEERVIEMNILNEIFYIMCSTNIMLLSQKAGYST